MLINKTQSYCCDCREYHAAEFAAEDNSVFFKVQCPQKEKNILISKRADIFLRLRNKSSFVYDSSIVSHCPLFSRVELTDKCNFHCALCYVDSAPENNSFISIEKIKKISSFLKHEKRFDVSLTGGEPTLHPELFDIIKIFKKSKFNVSIASNGYILAEDPTFALKLKQSGLDRCYIQLDTLKKDVHLKIRSNDFVEEKKRALRNLESAKVRTSTISVIIKDNVNEVGDILNLVKTLGPYFGEAVFLTAILDTGRYTLPKDLYVSKEEIIQSLIDNSGINGIGVDNFWPLPKFLPLKLNTHPDCATILYLLIKNNKIELLENYINIEKFYKLLSREKAGRKLFKAKLKGIKILVSCIRIKKIAALFHVLFSYVTNRGSCFINYVFIESFMSKYYQDKQRFNSCVTHHVIDENKSVSACMFNEHIDTIHPITRYKMQKELLK
ncbi:MAG: radical SAM protein [bacterium]|nr:radical SAM protein [bacterium]